MTRRPSARFVAFCETCNEYITSEGRVFHVGHGFIRELPQKPPRARKQSHPRRPPYTLDANIALDAVILCLRCAQGALVNAGFSGRPLLAKIRQALKSADGARRHQINRPARERRRSQTAHSPQDCNGGHGCDGVIDCLCPCHSSTR